MPPSLAFYSPSPQSTPNALPTHLTQPPRKCIQSPGHFYCRLPCKLMRISAGLYKWRLLWRNSQLATGSSQLATGNSQLATHNSCVKRDNGGFSFNKATRQAFLPATPHFWPQPDTHGQHPWRATTFSGSGSRFSLRSSGYASGRRLLNAVFLGFSCFWLFLTVLVAVVVWLCTWFLGKAANNIFVWLWRCCNCNGYSICLTNIRWREWERDDDDDDGETFSPAAKEKDRERGGEGREGDSRDCQISKLLAGIMRIFVWAALRLATRECTRLKTNCLAWPGLMAMWAQASTLEHVCECACVCDAGKGF